MRAADEEVERFRCVAAATETVLARAGMSSEEGGRLCSGGDTYKEWDFFEVSDAHAKATHAYDVARQAFERAARRRKRGADTGSGKKYPGVH